MEEATRQIAAAQADASQRPAITAFFDEATHTVSYLVFDPESREAAIIDPVLDYDSASGRTTFASADRIISAVQDEGLVVRWLIETHVHADHLSAATYIQQAVGGTLSIGSEITQVQKAFGKIFDVGAESNCDGSQFDRLFDDGDRLALGAIDGIALHVPGHTPADMAFVIGDAAFVGDTLFMPDYGTARADFPGGDAGQLFRSIRRLLSLPPTTRMFVCHDYKAPGREDYAWETSVAAQRDGNVHVHDGIDETEFVAMRTCRDETLRMPGLILPSIQINMRGGRLPDPESNGMRYLRIPLNAV